MTKILLVTTGGIFSRVIIKFRSWLKYDFQCFQGQLEIDQLLNVTQVCQSLP